MTEGLGLLISLLGIQVLKYLGIYASVVEEECNKGEEEND